MDSVETQLQSMGPRSQYRPSDWNYTAKWWVCLLPRIIECSMYTHIWSILARGITVGRG